MRSRQKRSFSELIFVGSITILFGGLAFGLGLYSGSKRNALHDLVKSVWSDVKLVHGELSNLIFADEPIHFLQPSRKPGRGVTVNERPVDGSLVLLAGFVDGGTEMRLVRRDGSPVARWLVSFSEYFPNALHMRRPPATDRNIDIHGALIHPDGSIVFNYEYGGTVKLSRCGEMVWTLAHQTHHSIETAEAGGYWIPGRIILSDSNPDAFPPFTRKSSDLGYQEDLILRVTENGVIAEQVSVPRILYDNGLDPVLTATGYRFGHDVDWESELVHVNKIGELPSTFADAFELFEAGDLVVSLRKYNLVLVVDPDDWSVKWHQTGPWRRQHDPEFNPDGTISVFNNNTYSIELGPNQESKPATPRVSNIIKINPDTGRTQDVYGEQAGQEFLTVIRGKHDPTPEGGFLITESEAGRVFETDAQGRIVSEYINRHDAQRVLEMTGARLYAESYFTVEDWSCPSAAGPTRSIVARYLSAPISSTASADNGHPTTALALELRLEWRLLSL